MKVIISLEPDDIRKDSDTIEELMSYLTHSSIEFKVVREGHHEDDKWIEHDKNVWYEKVIYPKEEVESYYKGVQE